MSSSDVEAMERAYAAGDHATARAKAHELLARPTEAQALTRAQAVLRETSVDWFLTVVGTLGLGLTAWLVYNYVL